MISTGYRRRKCTDSFTSLSTRPNWSPSPPVSTSNRKLRLYLFNLLVDAIGEQGLKATATGNLPRNFCRESALASPGEEEYQQWSDTAS